MSMMSFGQNIINTARGHIELFEIKRERLVGLQQNIDSQTNTKVKQIRSSIQHIDPQTN